MQRQVNNAVQRQFEGFWEDDEEFGDIESEGKNAKIYGVIMKINLFFII